MLCYQFKENILRAKVILFINVKLTFLFLILLSFTLFVTSQILIALYFNQSNFLTKVVLTFKEQPMKYFFENVLVFQEPHDVRIREISVLNWLI